MRYIPDYQNGLRVLSIPHENGGLLFRFDAKHGGQQHGVDWQCDSLDDDLDKPLSVLNTKIAGWPQHPVTPEQIREFKG